MYKELFVNLADAAAKAENGEKITGMIELNMEALVDYVKSVYMLEVSLTVARVRLGEDSREFAEHVAELDRKRRVCHEAAIASVSALNRMCDFFKVARVFDGDIDNRYEVADFCGNMVDEVFKSREKAVPVDVLAAARRA